MKHTLLIFTVVLLSPPAALRYRAADLAPALGQTDGNAFRVVVLMRVANGLLYNAVQLIPGVGFSIVGYPDQQGWAAR